MHQLHRVFVRVPLAALAVLLIGAASAARAENARLSAIKIDNFGVVNDHYYRGAQPTSADYPDLAALGVKTVIDLTRDGRDDEKGLVEAAGMKFVRIPLTTTEAPSRDGHHAVPRRWSPIRRISRSTSTARADAIARAR